jgi:SAM-dependent methyltransferase
MSELEFTGERFIPGTRGEIWIEHWHRYHFASAWAAGKRVLDVACGEGYGTALLSRHAASITGVDVSDKAIAHASATYASLPNATFTCASCTDMPLPAASVDLVVSFETLEHIDAHEAFLGEIARVLAPGGVLLMSCPNKAEYSDRRGFANEYHVKELYREELEALVRSRFPATRWFAQKPTFFSVIAPEAAPASGALVEVEETDPATASPVMAHPLYFIVAASRDAAALEAMPSTLHVLSDRGEWVHRDYEKVMGWMTQAVADRERLQKEVEALKAERQPPRESGNWLSRLFRGR